MINLAGGASTNSRASRPLPAGAVRALTLSVFGAYEVVRFIYADWRTEDKTLLTWVGGQSGLLFGGGPYPQSIAQAIQAGGSHGSYGHQAEYDLADELGIVFDGHLSDSDLAVRFFSNGGDACAAAVRIARSLTGQSVIGTQGYHGAQTDFGHQPAWAGYPYENVALHHRFEFGDVEAMRYAASVSSCLMIEVPAWDSELDITAFLQECRAAADQYHIPLIFDDVVCGFRLALAGTAQRYGVKPDMVCLGKAMSATGGISALIGRADMVNRLGDGRVFYSTTFGGNPDRCAVAAETVSYLRRHEPYVYDHIQKVGLALKSGLKAHGVSVVGQPERSALDFKNDADWLNFCSLVIEQGVMLHRPQFPTLAHTFADVDVTLAAVERALEREAVG